VGKSKRGCLLCGATPLTSAHLIARSFGAELPTTGDGVVYASRRRDDVSQSVLPEHRDFSSDAADQRVKQLCGPCNRDFMGSIESSIRESFVAMVRDEALVLTRDGAASLATWASLFAMLRATQDRGPRMIPPQHAANLRRNGTPPPGTSVWLGSCQAVPTIWTRHVRFALPAELGDGSTVLAHQTTLAWGALFLVVVGIANVEVADLLARNPPPLLSRSMTRIWPGSAPVPFPGELVSTEPRMRVISNCVLQFSGGVPLLDDYAVKTW
jgi:hypothetical protein